MAKEAAIAFKDSDKSEKSSSSVNSEVEPMEFDENQGQSCARLERESGDDSDESILKGVYTEIGEETK